MFTVYDSFFLIFLRQAYIDPGTGSIIIQVLIASLVGGLVIVKIFWNRIKTFVKSLFSKRHDEEDKE